MYSRTFGVAIAAFAGVVSAAPPRPSWQSGPGTGPTSTQCYTAMGTTTVPWAKPISWSTSYTECRSTSTITSTVTTAPSSITTTITVTDTDTETAPSTSFTSTVTTTTIETTTETTTETDTETDTTTTTTISTSTVPTAFGFLPIQTSDPGATFDSSTGGSPVGKRGLLDVSAGGLVDVSVGGNGKSGKGQGKPAAGFSQWVYPQEVRCIHYQPGHCKVTTVTTTTTIEGTSTSTVSTSTVSTSTSTIVPSATTTITISATNTETNTATTVETTTSTFTVLAAIETSVYAACATNNFADSYLGNSIGGAAQIAFGNMNVDVTAVESAYDCCVAAITNTGASQIWLYNGQGNCYIVSADRSPNQAQNAWRLLPGGAATVGNAYFGEYIP